MVHIEYKIDWNKSVTPCPYQHLLTEPNVCVGSYYCRYRCQCFIDIDEYSVECRADDLSDYTEEE